MTNPSVHTSRLTAIQILDRWLLDASFPDRLLAAAAPAQRAFVMEVVYGVVRWKRLLDHVIARLCPRDPDPSLKPALYVGLYQVLLMDTVAPHAAVHESVEAAKRFGLVHAAGFLNAVLRRAVRERERITSEWATAPLGVRESHPGTLVKRWVRQFGEAETEALCHWDNQRPRVVICPELTRVDLAAFRQQLEAAGIVVEPHPYAPDRFLILAPGVRVPDVPGFAEGHFYVQDPSTEVAVDLLDPQPGEHVLDACAAPGGKTMLMGARMQDTGRIVAADLHEDRLGPLRENVARLRRSSVVIVRADAASAEPAALGGCAVFDRILIDAPCTNTGVLRRRPDARWRFGLNRLATLVETQRQLLDACAGRLKPGGRLVFSTCSLEPEEGTRHIAAWLKLHPEFALQREVQLFPPTSRTDGAYAAALDRVG